MITPGVGYMIDPNNPNGVIPISQGTRNLQFQSGNTGAVMQQGQTSSQQTGASVPPPDFNTKLIELLKQYQQLGTKGFATQGLDASDAQAKRISAQTPQDLIGANPGLQDSVRSSYANALQPTIQGARSAQQTFGEQINSFGNQIQNVQQLMRDYQTEQSRVAGRMQDNVNSLITSRNIEGLKALPPEALKLAGYDQKTIQGIIKGIEGALAEERRQFEIKNTPTSPGETPLTATQKTAKDTLESVLTSLDSYRTLYNSLVNRTGVNLTGPDAGSLSGAYNALLFQIAQAAGTGALQAADREVVEAMIPNPTTVTGGFSSFVKGGRSGGLNAIDQARQIFVNKLNTLGPLTLSTTPPPTTPNSFGGGTSGTTSSGIKWTVTP